MDLSRALNINISQQFNDIQNTGCVKGTRTSQLLVRKSILTIDQGQLKEIGRFDPKTKKN